MSFKHGIKRYLSDDQLKLIRSFKIGIAGSGGLGSNCAMMLVRSGFKYFTLADFDRVDNSNLNRQFFFENQVGKLKTEALKENLIKINSDINVEIYNQTLDRNSLKDVFNDCNVLVEAFDSAFMKKTFVESFLNSEKFIVSASGISGFGMFDKIKTKKIKDNFYMVGDGISEASEETPPFAPSVIMASSMQADIVLNFALGKLQVLT